MNKYLITHQPSGGSVTNISDGIRLGEQDGIMTTVDSFSFSVVGTSKYDNFFNDGDNIKIYFWTDGNSPQIVMDGFIKTITLTITPDRRIYNISGQNRLEVLLNAPIPSAYSSTGTINNSAKIIKNLIGLAQQKWKTSKYQPTITAELTSLGGNIDDQSNTLSAINYYRIDTPVFRQIEELSTTLFTGVDSNTIGTYIYYLNSSNGFVWGPRSNTNATPNIEIGDFTEAKIEKVLFDVINFAIIDAGVDFNGKPIKTYVYNTTGVTKGFKGKYFVMHELAEQRKDGSSITSSTPFGNKEKNGNTDNSTFRNAVITDAKAEGNKIVGIMGQPRFKANITFKGTTSYSKGNIHSVRIPGIFRDINDNAVNQIDLRIKNIDHSFTAKGWFTTLEMQQDEKTITGSR